MDRFEELKNKYQPVLRLIKQLDFRLQNVHLENNKLLIRGAAASQAVKNKIWDQIKLINPTYEDLTADITIDTSLAPKPPEAAEETYTVRPGDTLSKISKQFYGEAGKYMRIFEANRDQLSDPNLIKVGQKLKIPK